MFTENKLPLSIQFMAPRFSFSFLVFANWITAQELYKSSGKNSKKQKGKMLSNKNIIPAPKKEQLNYTYITGLNDENINFSTITKEKANDYCYNDDIVFEDKILTYKDYFDVDKTKLRSEFIRIDSLRFYYTVYDTANNKILGGVAKIDKSISKKLVDTIPVSDLDGNIIRYSILKRIELQLVKAGNCFEKNDSSYFSGIYENSIKVGKWNEYKGYFEYSEDSPERTIFYNQDKIEKIDTVNLALLNNISDSSFCKKWIIENSIKSRRNRFIDSKSIGCCGNIYWIFRKDKTFRNDWQGCIFGSFEGTWSTNKNIITLKNEKVSEKLVIKYLSDKYLEFE